MDQINKGRSKKEGIESVLQLMDDTWKKGEMNEISNQHELER